MQTNERFETFTTTIIKAYKSINKLKNREMKKIGLKGNHTLFMFYFRKEKEGLTSAALSKLCNEDKAAVSRTIAELIDAGLIEYALVDCSKKYRNKFTLTEKGKNVSDEIDKHIAGLVNSASADLTENEREVFYKVLFEITDNIEELCKNN